MNQNGFKVNTDVNVKSSKKRTRKTTKKPLLMGTIAVVALFALIIAFFAFVPVRKVTVLETCVINRNNGNIQIAYYGKNGKVEKMVDNYNNTQNSYILYTYDNDSNILKEEYFAQDMLVAITNYIYKDGKLVRMENVSTDNKVGSAIEYQYNADGTVTMELIYDGEGNILVQQNHTYQGSVKIETNITDIQSNQTQSIFYTYSNGNIVKKVRASEGKEEITTYTYDNRGNVLTENTKGGDYVVYKYTFKTVKVPVFGK